MRGRSADPGAALVLRTVKLNYLSPVMLPPVVWTFLPLVMCLIMMFPTILKIMSIV